MRWFTLGGLTINLAQVKAFRIEEYGYKHPANPPQFHLKAYYSFEEIEQTVILGTFENTEQAGLCMQEILRGDYDVRIPPLSYYDVPDHVDVPDDDDDVELELDEDGLPF